VTGVANGMLDFSLRVWTNDQADWVQVRSDLAIKLRDGLAEAGIEVPLPQRDLHLRSVSAAAAGVLGAGDGEAPQRAD
jgi:small-conductance mechanosensitive channel